ncbi:MAG TPA: hypothetical protein VK659_06340, partial [Asanoa sp.]|nr:hypothetical protein [Asanoa sp.]
MANTAGGIRIVACSGCAARGGGACRGGGFPAGRGGLDTGRAATGGGLTGAFGICCGWAGGLAAGGEPAGPAAADAECAGQPAA